MFAFWFMEFQKKGRIISFWNFKLFNKNTWDISEKRTKELNLTLSIEYKSITPTVRDLIDYEADTVLKYLKGVKNESKN